MSTRRENAMRFRSKLVRQLIRLEVRRGPSNVIVQSLRKQIAGLDARLAAGEFDGPGPRTHTYIAGMVPVVPERGPTPMSQPGETGSESSAEPPVEHPGLEDLIAQLDPADRDFLFGPTPEQVERWTRELGLWPYDPSEHNTAPDEEDPDSDPDPDRLS